MKQITNKEELYTYLDDVINQSKNIFKNLIKIKEHNMQEENLENEKLLLLREQNGTIKKYETYISSLQNTLNIIRQEILRLISKIDNFNSITLHNQEITLLNKNLNCMFSFIQNGFIQLKNDNKELKLSQQTQINQQVSIQHSIEEIKKLNLLMKSEVNEIKNKKINFNPVIEQI